MWLYNFSSVTLSPIHMKRQSERVETAYFSIFHRFSLARCAKMLTKTYIALNRTIFTDTSDAINRMRFSTKVYMNCTLPPSGKYYHTPNYGCFDVEMACVRTYVLYMENVCWFHFFSTDKQQFKSPNEEV